MRSDNYAERLLVLGVATLHEALGRRHLLTGLRLLVGEPFAGPALTVELPAGDNLGLHLALEAANPGTVVCAGSLGRGLYGVIGEILHDAGRARGIAGFAIDDSIRDLAQLTPPPSIAARGVSARGTVKRRVRRPVGSNIAIGGALVASGDWLVCDGDGVCVIREVLIEDAIERGLSRLADEQQVRERVAAGITTRTILELADRPQASVP